jgi:hypothetical protein
LFKGQVLAAQAGKMWPWLADPNHSLFVVGAAGFLGVTERKPERLKVNWEKIK